VVRGALAGVAERRLAGVLAARLAEEPVVVLNGPRTVGKSTLLHQLGGHLGRPVIDCDDPAVRAAVRNDPNGFVAGAETVLIDEYQHVPELLHAIKAELNRDLRPGRYVLAGSTRYTTLPEAGQALTGRVDVIPVLPLSQGELDGTREGFVHCLLGGAVPETSAPASATHRDEYVRRATSGGLPVALRRPAGNSRSRWFSNYVNLVLERDVLELSRIRQRDMLPRLLRQLAAQSGQVLNVAAAGQAIDLEKSTAENYVKLLEAVFLIHRLPAWGTTLGSRIARQPKVHLVDSGVASWLLNVTPAKIVQGEPVALTEYGHLLETFAVGEILKQVSWWDAPVTAGHFRTGAGHEVDLVLERDDGQVIAFEVKAGSRIHGEDVRGIQELRSKLGGRLAAAIILYTGTYSYVHEGIAVLPLDRLWL
jgi:predicted AAA+ superfamily ATPase